MTDQLHVRDLVELAGQVAVESPAILSDREQISRNGLEGYWSASKFRLDRWGTALRKFEREVAKIGPSWADREWLLLTPILEEIFASEILTRVWCAVLAAHDKHHDQQEMEPTGHTIVVGHMEARNRILKLVSDCPAAHQESGQAIDELRRRCERWTDLLLSHVAGSPDLSRLAFDVDRANDFGESAERQRRARARQQAHSLTLGSLRSSFQAGLCETSPNADLNARIAAGVVACFPPDAFDPTGIVRSLWLSRVQNTAADAEALVQELLQMDRGVT